MGFVVGKILDVEFWFCYFVFCILNFVGSVAVSGVLLLMN